jgi:aspartate aminotransferase
MVDAFQRRRDLVVPALNAIDGIHCQNPKGAFYAFPNIGGMVERLGAAEAFDGLPANVKERSSPATLIQLFLLYEHKVATMDRRSFSTLGSEGYHYLRLSIANSDEELSEAVRRISVAAADADGFQEFVASGKRHTL